MTDVLRALTTLLLGSCIRYNILLLWPHEHLKNGSVSWNTLTDCFKISCTFCFWHSSRFSAIPYIHNFCSLFWRWHMLWLWMPSVCCLLHNKAEEMAVGRNETGQQMSFGHLSPGPWLSEVMRCVCTHQNQGHSMKENKKMASIFFLSSPAKGEVHREAAVLFRELYDLKYLNKVWALTSSLFIGVPHSFQYKEKHVS